MRVRVAEHPDDGGEQFSLQVTGHLHLEWPQGLSWPLTFDLQEAKEKELPLLGSVSALSPPRFPPMGAGERASVVLDYLLSNP